MTVAVNDLNSYAGITEYSWTGAAAGSDAIAVSIEAIHGHIQILQISLNLVTQGATSEEFKADINHAESTSLDTEFFAQNMLGYTEVLQRWSNDSGIYIPKGSSVDFTYPNTDDSAWGLSVLVRSE